ncbi:MAG: UbiD family decarboxylase [Methylobacteriaceae bacterium]|nr:UbiD family decarboxylase [Methylobacteriaceae bacterium]
MDQSFRGFLAALERSGEVQRVTRKVDPRFELASVLMLRDKGPAQIFENVTGHQMPVVANVLNSRTRFADALGITRADFDARLQHALQNPIPPVLVRDAPVKQCVHEGRIDVGALLPVPHWFERERAPYITAGVIVAKDPDTGRRNVSIARLRLEGGARLMAGIAPNHHLAILAGKARARGQKLEIAVVIGNHPAVLLGSQMYVGLGEDEFDIAGGLIGEPIELVRCRTIDVEVPAHAELVLEALLDAGDEIAEGPVSEFHGFYVDYGNGIAADVRCITRRKQPLFQAVLPGYAAEHCLLGGVAIGATLTRDLRRVIPAVRRVFITGGGMGRMHAVISMHRPRIGEGKRAIILAMGQVNLLKQVIVVEDDIDPEDARMVEWSLAARFRGEEDLIILPDMRADRCDPVAEDQLVTKIGIVATTRPGDGAPGTRSEFARPRDAVLDAVRRNLNTY